MTLVAVSKTHPPGMIREAFAAGCRDFGENYVQEALPKIAALADLPITWHYIGAIQSNKAADIAAHFDWVHGLESAKHAAALGRRRPAERGPLDVCIQVNISAEATKGGVTEAEVGALAREVAAIPGLRLRGLMGMASPVPDEKRVRAEFARLRGALEALRREGLALDSLSMGMTQDFEWALAEGATMLRIGTAIFGAREPRAVPA